MFLFSGESEHFDLNSSFQSSAAIRSSTSRGRLPSLILAAGTIEGSIGNTSIESLQSTIIGGAFDSKDSFSSLSEALSNPHLPADDHLNKRISTEEESADCESIPEPQAQDTFTISSTSHNKSLPLSDSSNKRRPEDINIISEDIDVYEDSQPSEKFISGFVSNEATNFSSKFPDLPPHRQPLKTILEESSTWSNTDSKMISGTSQTDRSQTSQDSSRTDLNNTGNDLKSIVKHLRKPGEKIENESSPDWYPSSTTAILKTPKNTLQPKNVAQRHGKKKNDSLMSPFSSVEANKENLNLKKTSLRETVTSAPKKNIVGFSSKVCQFSALNEGIDRSQKKKYPTTPRFRRNEDNSKSKNINTPTGSEDCFLERTYQNNLRRSFSFSDILREESTTPEVSKLSKETDLRSKTKNPIQNPGRFAERKPQERMKKYRKRRSKSLENNTNMPASSGIRPLAVPARRARGMIPILNCTV